MNDNNISTVFAWRQQESWNNIFMEKKTTTKFNDDLFTLLWTTCNNKNEFLSNSAFQNSNYGSAGALNNLSPHIILSIVLGHKRPRLILLPRSYHKIKIIPSCNNILFSLGVPRTLSDNNASFSNFSFCWRELEYC